MEDQDFTKFKRQIETEFQLLKKTNQILYLIVCAIVIWIFISVIKDSRNIDSIRTKQIIVEDISGKDRIIISSQIGKSKTRKRSDTLSGVLVLDETGNDRVILGASPTFKFNDTIINRSKNGPYGIAFNDEHGVEKGGFGYYSDRRLSAMGSVDGIESQQGNEYFVVSGRAIGTKYPFKLLVRDSANHLVNNHGSILVKYSISDEPFRIDVTLPHYSIASIMLKEQSLTLGQNTFVDILNRKEEVTFLEEPFSSITIHNDNQYARSVGLVRQTATSVSINSYITYERKLVKWGNRN